MSNALATQLDEEAHARLSPSGSKKWFACAGSITLEEPIPNTSSTYSDDGTAMHSIAAECLTKHIRAYKFIDTYIVVSREGEPERKVRITEAMADLVQEYVETVYAMTVHGSLLVEQRVNFSEFVDVPGQFGTADIVAFDEQQSELLVMDLKTGHTPVDVENNTQLMFYALGALALLRDNAAVITAMPVPNSNEAASEMAQPKEDDDEALF